jgi:hypothetical protein
MVVGGKADKSALGTIMHINNVLRHMELRPYMMFDRLPDYFVNDHYRVPWVGVVVVAQPRD